MNPNELYAILPYGTIVIPVSMLEQFMKEATYVERSYDSGKGFQYYPSSSRDQAEVTIIKGQRLVADFVAHRLGEDNGN